MILYQNYGSCASKNRKYWTTLLFREKFHLVFCFNIIAFVITENSKEWREKERERERERERESERIKVIEMYKSLFVNLENFVIMSHTHLIGISN